jgi:hypothetical protein
MVSFQRLELPTGHELPLNTSDQLPGRLQELQLMKRRNAGPVNCIHSLGSFLDWTVFG